ncbi:MAG: hypothetical protein C4563_10595 [Desulfobulbus sp.]|nr:MAG: hypothetical protein C4563_10595 [Desulfobulbus sp.]
MMKKISKKWFSLAIALSASVVVSAAAQAQTWEQWIDYGYPGYSETGESWRTYEYYAAHDYSYRYLSHWDRGLPRVGTATWKTDPLPYHGIYEVRVTFRASENRTPEANYFVVKDMYGNLEEHPISQLGEGVETVVLGRYEYRKGQQPYVLLDGTDDNYSDCADAAFFKLIEVLPDAVGPAVDLLLLRKEK